MKKLEPLYGAEFQDKLDSLAYALTQKVEQEWPVHLNHLPWALGFFGLTLQLARQTYRTVMFLGADDIQAHWGWRWEYTLILPAVNRTMLDSLFNVVFMLENLEERSLWYHRSGWREAKLELDRCVTEYNGDPDWQEWFAGTDQMLNSVRGAFQITDEEAKFPKKLVPWPNPGQMPDYKVNPNNRPPSRQFLHFINDWFYREHSAQSHSSFFGFMRLGSLLLRTSRQMSADHKEQIESEFYPRHFGVQGARAAILLLCIASEVQHYFKFDPELDLRCLELWTIFTRKIMGAQELHSHRYAEFWPVTLIGSTA